MYIKTTKSKNSVYLQLIEGYRDPNDKKKVRHKVLANLGRLDQISNDPSWEESISKLTDILNFKNIIDIRKYKDSKSYNWGYICYKKLWNKFELNQILLNIQNSTKITFDLNNTCFLMTIQHLLNPSSKLSTYQKQKKYIGLQEVDLNHLYRSLDTLADNKENIEHHIFSSNIKLYNMKVDIVFYDVTTFYFESVSADSLKNFGYSKDCKVNEVQVVLGLLISKDGLPIGYELFPGNTLEQKTLETMLIKLKLRFNIENIIIVADRGLNSKLNLKKISDLKYDYIVASKIKGMTQDMKDKILEKNLTELNKDISYKILDYLNIYEDENGKHELHENLIITYSKKRDKKDKADRERLLKKTESLLQNPSRITSSNKKGGKKYILETQKTDWTLNEKLIKKDEQFDGYYGIQTSKKDYSLDQILNAHHTLWKIEESFRIMKTTLETRPIFHWTEKRIQGHFVMCFLAFLLHRAIELELENKYSPSQIRSTLNSMIFTELEFTKNNYLVLQKTKEADEILKKLNIKSPQNSCLSATFNIERLID